MKAKKMEYMVPDSTGAVEGKKYLLFRMDHDEGGYYSYATVRKDFPKVLEYDGLLYSRTGWNSDNGTVYYQEITLVATVAAIDKTAREACEAIIEASLSWTAEDEAKNPNFKRARTLAGLAINGF